MRLADFLVLVLTVVLAALIAPKMGDAWCNRHEFAQSEIATYKDLLDHFKLDYGRYPTTVESLAALHVSPKSLEGKRGPTSYTDRTTLIDPWGHPYLYRSDGKRYTLISYGVDGKPGGAGYDADIVDGSGD